MLPTHRRVWKDPFLRILLESFSTLASSSSNAEIDERLSDFGELVL